MEWIQQNIDNAVYVLEPDISDHALLFLRGEEQRKIVHNQFKFINGVSDIEGYTKEVDKI